MPTPLRNAWRRPRSDVYAKLSLQGVLAPYGVNAHSYWPGDGARWGVAASNYLDSAGVTAASVDNPVGLSLDALQAMTTVEKVINGDNEAALFTGASAINGTVVRDAAPGGGFAAKTTCSGGNAAHHVVVQMEANKAYQVSVRVYVPTGSLNTAQLFDANDGSWFGGSTTAKNSWVTITGNRLTSKASIWFLGIGDSNSSSIDGQIFYIDDLSIKEIPGIHATQGTTANKPILRRGLLNLLTQAQTYSHADWAKSTTGTASAPTLGALQLAPDGTTTAQRVTFSCPGALGSDQSMLDHASMTVVSGQPHTQIAYIKGTPGQTISFRNVAGSGYGNLTFDGTWQLLARAETSISTTGNLSIGLRGTTGSTTGTVVADLWTAGLFQGTYTAQQIIDAGGIPLTTSAAASNPGAGRYWAQFDGANDFMGLAAPPFQLSDDHCVLAYCLPTLPGALQVLVSPSYSDGSNYAGVLGIDATGKPFAEWSATTGGTRRITGPSSIIGQGTLLACRKVGNTKTLWVNGTLVGSDSTAQTGSVAASAYLGCWNGSSLYYQGYLGPSVLIKGAVGDASLADISRLILISQL